MVAHATSVWAGRGSGASNGASDGGTTMSEQYTPTKVSAAILYRGGGLDVGRPGRVNQASTPWSS